MGGQGEILVIIVNFGLSPYHLCCFGERPCEKKRENLLRTEDFQKKNGNEEGERKIATTKENRIYN